VTNLDAPCRGVFSRFGDVWVGNLFKRLRSLFSFSLNRNSSDDTSDVRHSPAKKGFLFSRETLQDICLIVAKIGCKNPGFPNLKSQKFT
jgi:hypothetical protein